MAAYYPPGRYLGRLTGQSLGKSKVKGTPQVALTFEIMKGLETATSRHAGEECYERTVYLYLVEGVALDIAREGLAAIGFNRKSIGSVDPSGLDYQDMTGVEVELKCKHEEWDGKPRERWEIVPPRKREEQATAERPSAHDVKRLDALLALPATSEPDMRPGSGQAPIPDDEIPF